MKKQKDYPDECPVFRTNPAWASGEFVQISDWHLTPNNAAVHLHYDDDSHGWHEIDIAVPVNKAAEDLLAAIREELGS